MPLLRVISVTLDVYGIMICLALIWGVCRSAVGKKKLNQIFIRMCLYNGGTLLGDIPNWLCEGTEHAWYGKALWGGSLLLYLCGILLLLAYTKYVVYYLETKIDVHRGVLMAVVTLSVIYIAGLLLSQFNGMYYWIDSGNYYHRGNLYIFSQSVIILILLIDTAVIYIYRDYLRKKEILAFSGYIVLPIIAVAVQYFFYGLSLTYTASTLVLLVIFIDIQSEQAFLIEQMENKLLQGRLSMLLGQIQPHFFYNSLTSIAHLCTVDAGLAREGLLNFAAYLRTNMDSLSKEAPVPFDEELKHTRFYLSIEKLRFGERLNVTYCLGPQDFMIPPLTLQPVVENAVRHGVVKREEGGTIIISTDETDKEWLVSVKDDGPGFNAQDDMLRDGVRHIGIHNVQQRIEYLCGGSLELVSIAGKGTCVTIKLPKRKGAE